MKEETTNVLRTNQSLVNDITNWLKPYTDEVISYVIEHHIDYIVSDDTTCKLLSMLSKAELEERTQLSMNIKDSLLNFIWSNDVFHIRNNSDSYRSVLYELYMKNI